MKLEIKENIIKFMIITGAIIPFVLGVRLIKVILK